MSEPGSCAYCSSDLAWDSPVALCPECLRRLGLRGEQHGDAAAPVAHAPEDTPGGVETPSADKLAEHFPNYGIIERLGQGETGTVYKARDRRIHWLVALKILRRRLGPEQRMQVLREARVMARLKHANIVTLHAVGEKHGLLFLVMEFVDGVTLRDLSRSKRFSEGEALGIAQQICHALQFARARGIVARNLNAQNVLVDKGAQVKVAGSAWRNCRVVSQAQSDFD